MNTVILSRINQLEQQILIHSILYYRLGCSIWDDFTFDSRAKELRNLVQEHPEEFGESILHKEFKSFDWVSGYDLPLYHDGYTAKAVWLMQEAKKRGELK